MTLSVLLAPLAHDCKIFLGEEDITSRTSCFKIEVVADIHEGRTKLILHCWSDTELKLQAVEDISVEVHDRNAQNQPDNERQENVLRPTPQSPPAEQEQQAGGGKIQEASVEENARASEGGGEQDRIYVFSNVCPLCGRLRRQCSCP